MNELREIPLFPLNVVLFPGMTLPLHIFEERYKMMINACFQEASEFGVVYGTDEQFSEVGCAAAVTAVIERFPDGRMNILTKGVRRFRVIERFRDPSLPSGSKPCLRAMAEAFEDEDEATDPELFERASQLYGEALRLTAGWTYLDPIRHATPDDLSFMVAAHLGLEADDKQAVLEMRSVNARLERVANVLERSLPGIREMKRRQGGNGHFG
ncbi:MAG: ATP-dependent protease [Candidatus Latescibacteria bacterium]|nr:ATP-dependent protease [Candidatus Latescibacterota bacterium]